MLTRLYKVVLIISLSILVNSCYARAGLSPPTSPAITSVIFAKRETCDAESVKVVRIVAGSFAALTSKYNRWWKDRDKINILYTFCKRAPSLH